MFSYGWRVGNQSLILSLTDAQAEQQASEGAWSSRSFENPG